MTTISNIIQWNLDSWKSKFTQLSSLITLYSPEIIALQETKLSPEYQTSKQLTQFDIYRKDRNFRGGGVAILVLKKIPHTSVPLNTTLEAIAVKIHLQNLQITFCNIYIPPGIRFPENEINNLIAQLSGPYFIVGDFNSKSPLWGSPVSNSSGRKMSTIITNNSLNILNTGKPTHHIIQNNYFSHLDLALCSPHLSDKLNWDVADELFDSHHYPIIISHSCCHFYTKSPQRWDIRQTTVENWKSFSNSVNLPETFTNPNLACRAIIDHILDIASLHLKKTSGKTGTKYANPWWSPKCALALYKKRIALQKLKRHHSDRNLQDFKMARALARLIINTAKRSSWRKFLSEINRFTPISTIWNKIKKLSCKSYNLHKMSLQIDNSITFNPLVISETMGSFYANISSSQNYRPEFLINKQILESTVLNFNTPNAYKYNDPICMDEFLRALHDSDETSPGEDTLPYEMYKKLPPKEQQKLVNFFNYLFLNNLFPDQWRNAQTIPNQKPNLPPHHTDLSS